MSTMEQLRAAIDAIAGQQILEWRNGYGDSGSLYIGKRGAKRHQLATGPRESTALNVWEAQVALLLNAFDDESRLHPPAELRTLNLESLVGRTVSSAMVAADGTLTIEFVPAGKLVVSPSIDCTEDEEQWAIVSVSHGTLIVLRGPKVVEDSEYPSE